MQIYGLHKTTLLDYPGHVAATIFTGYCNFRCPYCHNASLVLKPETQTAFSVEEILSFLQKRKNLLSGVCISGGEPTLQPDLFDFIHSIKSLGYLVKLDTNGSSPQVLKQLIDANLLDYVAMDVKSNFSKYPLITGISSLSLESVRESISLLLHSSIDYEFRTTIVPELHTIPDLLKLASEIKDCKAYYLQPYQDSPDILNGHFSSFSETELAHILTSVQKIIPHAKLRG